MKIIKDSIVSIYYEEKEKVATSRIVESFKSKGFFFSNDDGKCVQLHLTEKTVYESDIVSEPTFSGALKSLSK